MFKIYHLTIVDDIETTAVSTRVPIASQAGDRKQETRNVTKLNVKVSHTTLVHNETNHKSFYCNSKNTARIKIK